MTYMEGQLLCNSWNHDYFEECDRQNPVRRSILEFGQDIVSDSLAILIHFGGFIVACMYVGSRASDFI